MGSHVRFFGRRVHGQPRGVSALKEWRIGEPALSLVALDGQYNLGRRSVTLAIFNPKRKKLFKKEQ